MSKKESKTLLLDSEYGDGFVDVSKQEKRFVRASVKTYEGSSGTYITLKLFKRTGGSSDDYQFNQKVSLTLNEFEKLASNYQKILSIAKPSFLPGENLQPTPLKTSTLKRSRKSNPVVEDEDSCQIC